MITNMIILILEVILLGVTVLGLHRVSTRYGLIPLLAFILTLTVFVQTSNTLLIYIKVEPHLYIVFAASICIPIILLAVLLLYIIEGTVVARLTILSILGANILYYFLFWRSKVHLSLPGGGSFLGLTSDSPFLTFSLPNTLASSIAFIADLFIIAIIYQGIKNNTSRLPVWVAPGVALLISLWSDTFLYQGLCCGIPSSSFFLDLVDDLLGKTVIGIMLWPLIAVYLGSIAPNIRGFQNTEKRPTFDLLFGPFHNMEIALARSEANLYESKELYQSLVEVMPMGVCRKDLDGRLTFVNQYYCDQLGLSASDILGKTDFDFYPKPLAEKQRQNDIAVITSGKIVEVVEEHQPFNREPGYKQSIKTPIHNARGEVSGVQVVFWDITERMRTEAEREELIAELESRNTELERFTYTVSHDLKSPLVTINGYLGYLEQDAASGNMERLKSDTQRIYEAVNKMHMLLTELLELSRIGRMINPPVAVPFEDLVKDAIDIIHGQLEKRKIALQTQPNLPIVHGDRQRLTEVLQNLLDNATKYMGDQPNPIIEIGQNGEEDGKPIFFVKDNGIGVAIEHHERIFGLFNKLDPKSEGTGIGLALVKRIIEIHGGRIWVESELGRGTTFYFTMPRG